MKSSISMMKYYKLIVYGLVGSVLLVTTLFVNHECDPDSTQPWKRLSQPATAIKHNQESITSSTSKPRLKPRTNRNMSVKRGLNSGSTGTGYGVRFGLEGRTTTSGHVPGSLNIDVIPGERSSSTVDWDESEVEEWGTASPEASVKEPASRLYDEGDIQQLYDEGPRKTVEYYGVPVKGQSYVVIYNAVPKTGSRAFFGAIRMAVNSSKNTRHIKMDSIRRRDRHSRKDFFNFIYNKTPPVVLRGHVPFVGLPSRFLYINIVREPMERFISEYYFMRNGDSRIRASSSQRSHGYNPKDLPNGWNDTLDECVTKGSHLCLPASGMMRLFCGFSLKCSTPSRWTLDQAKSNLDRYTVVGLTNDFDTSLEVLERLLPDMTGNVAAIFKNQTLETSKYQTNNRQEPLDSTKKSLRHQMAYEYEFYHLVKDKFYKLKESLGIS